MKNWSGQIQLKDRHYRCDVECHERGWKGVIYFQGKSMLPEGFTFDTNIGRIEVEKTSPMTGDTETTLIFFRGTGEPTLP